MWIQSLLRNIHSFIAPMGQCCPARTDEDLFIKFSIKWEYKEIEELQDELEKCKRFVRDSPDEKWSNEDAKECHLWLARRKIRRVEGEIRDCQMYIQEQEKRLEKRCCCFWTIKSQ